MDPVDSGTIAEAPTLMDPLLHLFPPCLVTCMTPGRIDPGIGIERGCEQGSEDDTDQYVAIGKRDAARKGTSCYPIAPGHIKRSLKHFHLTPPSQLGKGASKLIARSAAPKEATSAPAPKRPQPQTFLPPPASHRNPQPSSTRAAATGNVNSAYASSPNTPNSNTSRPQRTSPSSTPSSSMTTPLEPPSTPLLPKQAYPPTRACSRNCATCRTGCRSTPATSSSRRRFCTTFLASKSSASASTPSSTG